MDIDHIGRLHFKHGFSPSQIALALRLDAEQISQLLQSAFDSQGVRRDAKRTISSLSKGELLDCQHVTGITLQTLSAWQSKPPMQIKRAVSLARLLNTTVEELWDSSAFTD